MIDAYDTYLAAFCLFMGGVYYYGWPLVQGLIDQHIGEIYQKLDEATRYREDALAFLNSCKRKHMEAKQRAEKIIESAKVEAATLEAQYQQQIQEFEIHQTRLAAEKIQKLERAVLQQIRSKIADETVRRAHEACQQQ